MINLINFIKKFSRKKFFNRKNEKKIILKDYSKSSYSCLFTFDIEILAKTSPERHTNNSMFSYLKTKHSFHLVDPSPWPIMILLGTLMLTTGFVLYMQKFLGSIILIITGTIQVLLVMSTWWRDVIREATFEEQHTIVVQRGIRLAVILFIVSEIMFFFAFFWAFFHSSLFSEFNIKEIWPSNIMIFQGFYYPTIEHAVLQPKAPTALELPKAGLFIEDLPKVDLPQPEKCLGDESSFYQKNKKLIFIGGTVTFIAVVVFIYIYGKNTPPGGGDSGSIISKVIDVSAEARVPSRWDKYESILEPVTSCNHATSITHEKSLSLSGSISSDAYASAELLSLSEILKDFL